jgi:hypothetical protein
LQFVSIAASRHRNLAPPPDGAKWGANPPGAIVGADIRLEYPRSLWIRTSAPRPKDSNVGGTGLIVGGAKTLFVGVRSLLGAGPAPGAV